MIYRVLLPLLKLSRASSSIISHSEWPNFFVPFADLSPFTVSFSKSEEWMVSHPGSTPNTGLSSLISTLIPPSECIYSNGFNNQLYANDPKILSPVLTFDLCSSLQVLPASRICMPCWTNCHLFKLNWLITYISMPSFKLPFFSLPSE